jgi:hypothetical protein
MLSLGGNLVKRTRKPPVIIEVRRDWIRRHEENNESPPQIAEKDGFDVRTARKHLNLAKQEREAHEARSTVLRNAMEQHYRDLLNYTELLNHRIFGSGEAPILTDKDLIESALRQHLPRSPIWNLKLKLERLETQVEKQRRLVTSFFEEAVMSDKRLSALLGRNEITSKIIEILRFQAEQWSHGPQEYNLSNNPVVESAREGLVNIRYGQFAFDKIEASRTSEISQTLQLLTGELEARLKNSEVYAGLEKLWAETKHTRRKLREELAVIRFRRILPGRCRYCPL